MDKADIDLYLGTIEERMREVQTNGPGRKLFTPPPIWLTERQLAEYWQLRTSNGEVTLHSIRKWTARPDHEHPLPCASMGEMRRYHREEVDRWAREEAARQKSKRHPEMKTVERLAS